MKAEKVIGVTMKPQNSILNKNDSYEKMAKVIAEHLMTSRGRANPYWKPYIKQEGISFKGGRRCFDAKVLYPDSRPGDVVYTACDLWLEKDYEIWINVIGMVQVYLDDECLFSSREMAEESVKNNKFISLPVALSADRLHRLIIKTVCTEDGFGFQLNVSPPRCVGLWGNFYLIMARTLLPIEGLTKEEGMAISPLYTGAESPEEAYEKHYAFEDMPEYAYPEIQKESSKIEFAKLYDEGNVAFAYTVAETDGYVVIRADSAAKILVNGEKYSTLQSGEQVRVALKAEDVLLVKSMKEDAWGFEWKEAAGIGLPMLETERKQDFTFALCGPFHQKGLEVKLPPEHAENLLQPFPDGKGGRVFWRFQHAYLRAYIDSSFFGQWYYATMLSFNGIRCCGEAFDVPEYVNYFLDNQRFLADWYEYAVYDGEAFGYYSFMQGVAAENSLDHIGTMGVNFVEAYRMTGDRRFLPLIRMLQWRIGHKVLRFEDGTFRRNYRKTMWADDFYMSCPFLVQLYSQFGDVDSLRDILCQLKGNVERLYLPDEKIFSHIYFWEEQVKNAVPWGRGNGWLAFAMSEILLRIPKEDPAHEEIQKVFCELCEGIAALQDESGLWHQVLNKPESYLESSCTAMFALAFYRGVNNGWLPESFLKYADKALQAILQQCVDEEGVVYGVCMGSSCSMDQKYYFELQTIKDDNHGTGVVLMLLCERASMDSPV